MKKTTALMIGIIGVFLSMLGAAMFCLLFVLWGVEGYSSYSLPLWPMVIGIGIAVLGLACVKAGTTSIYY